MKFFDELTKDLVALAEGRTLGFLGFLGSLFKGIGKIAYGGLDSLLGGVLPNLGGGGGGGGNQNAVTTDNFGSVLSKALGPILSGGTNSNLTASNAITPILAGVGGALANRDEVSRIEPNLTPDMQTLRDQLVRQTMGITDISGIQAKGISDINHSSDLYKQNLTENLGARGITGPAAELALSNADANRFSDVTRYKQGMPLLAAQLLNQGAGLLNGVPRGQTQTIQGNKLGGLVSSLGQYIASMQGQAMANGGVSGSATPNAPKTATSTPPQFTTDPEILALLQQLTASLPR